MLNAVIRFSLRYRLLIVVHHGAVGGPGAEGISITRGSVAGRAVVDGRTVHLHDSAVAPEDEFPIARVLGERFGVRTVLATPLIRDGIPIGTILMRRLAVRRYRSASGRRNVPSLSWAKACRSSSWVFMTIGPYQATGSLRGWPDTSKNRTPSSPV